MPDAEQRHRPTLLIADDEPTNLQVLRQILQADHRLLFAKDGAKAVELAQSEKPDLILLDVMMPGSMDGLELCRRLRQHAALHAIPVILLTARSQQRDIEIGFEAGANAYLTKPFSPMELLDRIAGLLNPPEPG